MTDRTENDFPCASCGVDRRAFLTQSALAMVGALVATGCGDGQIGGPLGVAPTPLPSGFTISLANFPALATVGGTARVDANTAQPIAVTRTGPSTFIALSMVCPHAAFKPIQITAPGFRCPNHGAEFTSDGNWVGGQRTGDLERYPVSYNAAAGTLTIG